MEYIQDTLYIDDRHSPLKVCVRMGSVRLLFIVAVTLFAWSGVANAAELVMYRRAGCAWCEAWDRDIGAVYRKTEIGQRLPIRFVHLDRDEDAKLSLKHPVRYSPTFILTEGGQEFGRIEGYPGDAFFWGLLERLAERLPEATANLPPARRQN
jgi:hypothetical protein